MIVVLSTVIACILTALLACFSGTSDKRAE